jgi:preprotein translocase subunit SecD
MTSCGSYVEFGIDTQRERSDLLEIHRDRTKEVLADSDISYANFQASGEALTFDVRDRRDSERAKERLRAAWPGPGDLLITAAPVTPPRSKSEPVPYRVRVVAPMGRRDPQQEVFQAMARLSQRAKGRGIPATEFVEISTGKYRLLFDGADDAARFLDGNKVADVSIRLVDDRGDQRAATGSDSWEQLPNDDGDASKILVSRSAVIDRDHLTDVYPYWDETDPRPFLNFTVDRIGRQQAAAVAKSDQDQRLAIVVDGRVAALISVSVLRENSWSSVGPMDRERAWALTRLLNADALGRSVNLGVGGRCSSTTTP